MGESHIQFITVRYGRTGMDRATSVGCTMAVDWGCPDIQDNFVDVR